VKGFVRGVRHVGGEGLWKAIRVRGIGKREVETVKGNRKE
jgi:hypothetical protein